ncbi:hypothetical protein V499_07470 [Pseudogymnoascus sp. VKM F-103]|nr:hypothetical protein V499_07470 [Pseudogymnoascus sp. VKM F-103]
MADFHGSSNPFRRRTPAIQTNIENGTKAEESTGTRQLPIDQPMRHGDAPIKNNDKPMKHVRVQSPPPSSPEDTIQDKPHTPLPQGDEGHALGNDPFESVLSDESSDDNDDEIPPIIGAGNNGRVPIAPISVAGNDERTPIPPISAAGNDGRTPIPPTSGAGNDGRAPMNPFSKTLATLERTEGKESTSETPPVVSGKAAMDVESFKRLLMTGSSGIAAPESLPSPPAQSAHAGPADGSSTEASSVSRHSIFENIQENLPESPRTSHEVSDADDERRRIPTTLQRSASERKKPPPPSSRHGKLINVQLRDDARPHSLYVTSTSAPSPLSSTIPTLTAAQRSATDLNKPLPPNPSRASHESDRESIFDRESVGKAPEPPSPSNSLRRKTAPAPPSARRHGVPVADPNSPHLPPKRLTNMGDDSRNSSIQDLSSLHPSTNQQATIKAPPPPPLRRPGSIRNSVISPTVTMSDLENAPSIPRAPSTPSKRLSVVPPPPPRPRGASGASIDANPSNPAASTTERPDILADLSALQKEIDALRGRAA